MSVGPVTTVHTFEPCLGPTGENDALVLGGRAPVKAAGYDRRGPRGHQPVDLVEVRDGVENGDEIERAIRERQPRRRSLTVGKVRALMEPLGLPHHGSGKINTYDGRVGPAVGNGGRRVARPDADVEHPARRGAGLHAGQERVEVPRCLTHLAPHEGRDGEIDPGQESVVGPRPPGTEQVDRGRVTFTTWRRPGVEGVSRTTTLRPQSRPTPFRDDRRLLQVVRNVNPGTPLPVRRAGALGTRPPIDGD